jgi:hypothetical protein
MPRSISPQDSRRLRDLSGVGPSIERDLVSLGIQSVMQLARADGRKLYDRLCRQTGKRQDPCVWDVFECAIAQARHPDLPAEQRNWWFYSRSRKQRASAT